MSDDESVIDDNVIPLPVYKLKAETLRSIARELGVVAGGKKLEVLQRLRACSDSGRVTPDKRKLDPDCESPSLSVKKPKNPKTTPESLTTSTAPSSPTRRNRHVNDDESPKRPQHSEPSKGVDSLACGGIHHEPISRSNTFDNGLNVVLTSGFIAGDDLLTMVDVIETPAPAAFVLWKGTTNLSERDQTSIDMIDPWLILAHQDGNIQNVAAFKAAYGDVLEEERVQQLASPDSKGASDDVDDKGRPVVISEKSPKRLFEVSISRNMQKGALAIKLLKGAIEENRIVLAKDAREEGIFWLSQPTVASQANLELLDHVVELLL